MKRQGDFCSPSSSSSKKNKLPTSQKKPVAVFNPLPPVPRNDRHQNQERIFLHHQIPKVRPRILHVTGDGQLETKKTASPSGDDLVLIGQSRDKVCFENLSSKKICIWDLKKEKMENEVEFEWRVPAAHGFGHTRTGQLKIVRFLIPTVGASSFSLEICKENEKKKKELVWAKKEVNSLVPYYPSDKDFAKLVSKDSMLFWKGGLVHEVQIIKFDLENEDLGLLVPPQDEDLKPTNMSLGHGFQGRLSLCVHTHPSPQEPFSELNVWTLEKNQGGGDGEFWHKLLTLPLDHTAYLLEPYVPLSFFHGRGDWGLNLLFHRNKAQIFQIVVRGNDIVSEAIVPTFSYREKSLSLPFVCSTFQATPLAPKTLFLLEPSKPITEKENKEEKKNWDATRLSFADDLE